MGSLYRSQHELVFVFKYGTGRHTNNIELGTYGRNRSNVWRYDSASTQARKGNNLLALHPTAKPVDLIIDVLLDCSHRGEIVLNSFLEVAQRSLQPNERVAPAAASNSIRSMSILRSGAGRT